MCVATFKADSAAAGARSTAKLILAALGTDEANLVDLVRFWQGNRFSLTVLEGEISRLDLGAAFVSFEIPLFFLLGRHDWHIPAVAAAEYFDRIAAPCKRLLWFEGSAHNPPFEEPDRFNRVLIEQILPLVRGEAACP